MAFISVRTIIFSVVAAMIVMSAISFSIIELWAVEAEGDATVINIAGRQRMLTQKMIKESLLVSGGFLEQQKLEETKNLFENSLTKLIKGDTDKGIYPAPAEVASSLEEVNKLWEQYKLEIDSLAAGNSTNTVNINNLSIAILKSSNAAVKIYESLAKDKITLLKIETAIILIANLLVAGIAFYLVKRFVISRLTELKDTIVKTEKSLDLSTTANVTGNDEIASIANSFNSMLNRFKQVIDVVKERISQSEMGVQDLQNITTNTINSMNDQNEVLGSVATATEELAASFNAVTDSIEYTVQTAKSCSDESEAGYQLGAQGVSRINELGQAFERTSEAINILGKDSNAIASILDTIRNIAEQTNLLALNAAIEAARAGEQGRGFAVVADEVRTLAQRTQSATQEIHDLIDNLMSGVKAAVDTVEEGHERVNDSVANAQQVQTALQTIKEKINKTLEMSEDIKVATDQQKQALNDVNLGMHTVSDRAQSTFNTGLSAQSLNEGLLVINKEMHQSSEVFRT